MLVRHGPHRERWLRIPSVPPHFSSLGAPTYFSSHLNFPAFFSLFTPPLPPSSYLLHFSLPALLSLSPHQPLWMDAREQGDEWTCFHSEVCFIKLWHDVPTPSCTNTHSFGVLRSAPRRRKWVDYRPAVEDLQISRRGWAQEEWKKENHTKEEDGGLKMDQWMQVKNKMCAQTQEFAEKLNKWMCLYLDEKED